MATDVIVLDAVESIADDIDKTLGNKLDPFIDEATYIVEQLGSGLPPRDMISFTSQSTDGGIKLTFTPPKPTYLSEHTSGDGKQFACMPAGVVIRYSDKEYPRTPNEGVLGYDYKPNGDWDTESHECTIVGLTKDKKYYITAFPYSTEHVYNKNQIAGNRTEMTWVGNKGTISVDVKTPDGYQGTLGEYTITLIDQASSGGQNIEQTANGAGVTRFGNLEGGKTYKVRLSTTSDLQAPADSEPITIVGGMNYDVTMTYVSRYGTITVNVSTQPAGMPIGAYTVTLTPQGGGEAKTAQGNNTQAVAFSNCENGTVYTVSLSAINRYTANSGGTVTAIGGQNVSHNASYAIIYNPTLQNNDWETISAISASGRASEFWSVGDTKKLTIDGTVLNMEIIGFNHDPLADGSGYAGITFNSKNVFNERSMNDTTTNSGSFVGSDLYQWLSTTLYNKLPNDLKSVIKSVKKKTSAGNNNSAIREDVMKLFLLAEVEATYANNSYSGEGSRYSAFYSSNSYRKDDSYWFRSPAKGSTTHFVIVYGTGTVSSFSASGKTNVSFCFCV